MIAMRHDTLSVAKRLLGKGFTQEQAEAIAYEVQEVGREDHLVTKEYLDEKLEKTELRLTLKFGAMLFVGIGFLAAIKFFGG